MAESEEIAKTTSGRKVVLLSDGTWRDYELHMLAATECRATSTPDFRNAFWGMNRQQVKESETAQLADETAASLSYPSIIAGFPCEIFYIFAADKFVRAKYIFTQDHSNPTVFIDDFDKLVELLAKKYGEGDANDYWNNDLYQDDPDEWGMAIGMGHLSKYCIWRFSGTTITLALNGDNHDIRFSVEYLSDKLSRFEDQVIQQRLLEGL